MDQTNINSKMLSHPIIDIEKNINSFWNINIKQKYLNIKSNKKFIVRDGPPFATGSPHYGHFLAGSIKDTIIRYKTLQGYEINKIAGWDCHGVPIEMLVNKKLNINSKFDIINNIGIDKYCTTCKNSVLECADQWDNIMDRFGRWADFKNAYKTMDLKYCNCVWNMFNIVNEQGLLSQGYRVCSYSTGLETSLSNFESSLNYQLRNDNTLTFCVKLKNFFLDNCYISVFTTTPWTLPGNCCIAINKNYTYIAKYINNKYIISIYNNITDTLPNDDQSEEATIGELASPNNILINGSLLVNISYIPLFNFLDHLYNPNNSYKIYHGNFVTNTVGTGAVHIAPMYGEDDYTLAMENKIIIENNLNKYDYLNTHGELNDIIGTFFDKDYKPTLCFLMNTKIIKYIKIFMNDNFIKSEQINHNYPYCWRTNTPLIYRATPSWMINVSSIKNELIKINKTINWYPSNIGSGRFNNWLENIKDWNISRSRIWGIPLPIWKEINGDKILIIKSIEHLQELTNINIDDIHRNNIDHIIIEVNNIKYKRIPDVFDCWFESGSVGLYFSSENKYECADFIAEGLDQTRGWFYTLLVLGYISSTQLNKKPLAPFKNVIVNGLILAKDGKKMSKSLNNYTDPIILINKYGSDALRLYLLSSCATRAEDLKFDDEGVLNKFKSILIQLYNTIQFIEIYKKYHNKFIIKYSKIIIHPLNSWILFKLNELELNFHNNYENYKIDSNINLLIEFIDCMNNDYLKLNRPIFKNQSQDPDINDYTIESIYIIYLVLLRLVFLTAPIMPYMSEYIFLKCKEIINYDLEESIHLCNYDYFYNKINDIKLNELDINYINEQFKLLNIIRKFRFNNNFSNKRIIKKIIYYNLKLINISDIFLSEINTLEIEFNEFNNDYIKLKPILNDKNIFNIFKKDGNLVKKLINNLNDTQLYQLNNNNNIIIDNYTINPNMIEKWEYTLIDTFNYDNLYKKIIGSDYVLLVDTSYDTDMENIFLVKNLARKFQQMRKFNNLHPSDPVILSIKTDNNDIIQILNKYSDKYFYEITNHQINIINTNNHIDFYYKNIFEYNLNDIEYNLELFLS
jgi:isoleucyl-tRNA synthetase